MTGRSLTRVEVVALAVVSGIAMLLFWSVLGSGLNGGTLSPRLLCASNLKRIGTSCKIYANDSGGSWPIPAFDEGFAGSIDYRVQVGGGAGTVQSPRRSEPSQPGPGGTTELSVSRALWMLVRTGDTTLRDVICPVSGDTEDPTWDLTASYDFVSYKNLSYGYQVPYGPDATRPRDGMDNRTVLAADKGPYVNASVSGPPPGLKPIAPPTRGHQPKSPGPWAAYNSSNHPGEGQNVLYADGHVSFARHPTIGVDGDNIYTVALDNSNEASRVAGEPPWRRSLPPFCPPPNADGVQLWSTDSVIFP